RATLMKPVKQSELLDTILGVLSRDGPAAGAPGAPPAPREAAARERAGPPALPALRPLHILLAEDNPVNQTLALRILQKPGHTGAVAGTGGEAVADWEKAPYDVVLMDVQMPEMGGFEATALIRAREQGSGRHTPIIALTAHAMKGDRERCLQAGMDGYVAKPISVDDLRRGLGGLTRTSHAGGGARPQEPAPP